MKSIYNLFALLFILTSCSHSPERVVSIGEPEIITDFQLSSPLNEINSFPGDSAIGVRSIKVVDTLLIADRITNWTIYSLRSKRDLGNCLSIGQAPFEFVRMPYLSKVGFFKENDSIIAYIPDINAGRIMRFNVTRFSETGEVDVHEHIKSPYLTNQTWSVTPMDSSKFLVSVPNTEFTGFKRLLIHGEEATEPEIVKGIDNATVSPEKDINYLSGVTRHCPNNGMFVESMLYLNQLNIFSVDGNKGKTIVVGDCPDNLSDVEAQLNMNRKFHYNTCAAWDNGFGAIYIGQPAYLEENYSKCELQVFDWDGNPIYRTELPYMLSGLDIDFGSNTLYGVDRDGQSIVAFDAKPITERLH